MSIDSLGGARPGRNRAAAQQCAGAVLMIRPAAFEYNLETAATNMLQKSLGASALDQQTALQEFDGFANALRSEGVAVCVVQDTPSPSKPDAVFPNNWVSFHGDGTVVLYPMQAESRRPERRREVIEEVTRRLGFEVRRTLDLTKHEASGRYLEGTGSLVLDHVERIAYACVSPRTHPAVVKEWAAELGYQPMIFEASDRNGVPYYHTNVMMCVGSRVAILGTCAMSGSDRERIVERVAATGRDIIEVDYEEIGQFAGNMLELASWDEALGDCRLLVMSDTARRALRPDTYARLSASTDCILAPPVPTIERLGGGGVRCMLAEVFVNS